LENTEEVVFRKRGGRKNDRNRVVEWGQAGKKNDKTDQKGAMRMLFASEGSVEKGEVHVTQKIPNNVKMAGKKKKKGNHFCPGRPKVRWKGGVLRRGKKPAVVTAGKTD